MNGEVIQSERTKALHPTPKGKQWRFGMKLHVGTGPHGTEHTVTATDAAGASAGAAARAGAGAVWGQAYWRQVHRAECVTEGRTSG